MLGNSSAETWALAMWQPQPPILQHPLPHKHMLDSWLPTTKRFSLCYSSDTAPIRHCSSMQGIRQPELHPVCRTQRGTRIPTEKQTCILHTYAHTRQCHTWEQTTPTMPLQLPSHLHRLCHAQTCTHVDMNPETWSFKHMLAHTCTCVQTSMCTHKHVCVRTLHLQAGCCSGMDTCCRYTLVNSNMERTIPGGSPTPCNELPQVLRDCFSRRCRL